MSKPVVHLEPASARYLEAFVDCAADYQAAGEDRYDAVLADPEAYLRWVADMAHEATCPVGLVPQTTYWAMDEEQRVLACSRLRQRLSPALLIEGGHIGYGVRPSARRRGLGGRLLGLTLEETRGISLSQVLLTCDDDNLASTRIILGHGGREIGTSVSARTAKVVRRFWIAVL